MDILNGEGKFCWVDPNERLNTVVKEITPQLQDIKHKMDENSKKMYPEKLNFIGEINNYIDDAVRQGARVRYDDAIAIDYDTLLGFYNAWFKLMKFIRGYYPKYFANKQLFSAFCGFNSSAFDKLSASQNGDILALMESLIDSFVDGNFAAGQSGTAVNSMTASRLKAGGTAGYDVKIKNDSDQQTTNNFLLIDNESTLKKLKNLGFNNK